MCVGVAVMEKTKQTKRRAVNNGNTAVSGTVLTPTTNAVTNSSTTTTSVEDAFQDLVQQLSKNSTTVADFDQLVGNGDILGSQQQQQQQQHQSLQTCLDQLGNDISVIKTQLEKKKSKASLLDVNEKVDQILQFLKNRYSAADIKMELS